MATQTDLWQLTSGAATGEARQRVPRAWTYTADATAAGAFTATVVIEVRNGSGAWILYGTMTLSGTGSGSDYLQAGEAPWGEHRARLTASTGSPTVNVVGAGGA